MSDARPAATATPLLDPASLTAMLRPRSVAIVGASNDPTRIGGRPLRYYRENGFPGAIIGLHDGGGPRSQTVAAIDAAIPQILARGYQIRPVC